MDPNPRQAQPNLDIENPEAGIVEGSDVHIDFGPEDFDDVKPEPRQPEQQEVKQPVETKQTNEPKQPNKEDLVERQLATTVVPALRNENNSLRGEVEKLRNEASTYKELNDNIRIHGLTPDEAKFGMQFAATWKTSPERMINQLLTYAQSKGIKVEGSAGVSAEAVLKMVEERLAPVLQRSKQEEEQQRRQQEATREANDFFTRYPDAATQQNEIATLMAKRGLSLNDAYTQLRVYAADNGLNWNEPITPQLQKRQQQPPTAGNDYSPGPRVSSLPSHEGELPGDDYSYRNIVDRVLAGQGIVR